MDFINLSQNTILPSTIKYIRYFVALSCQHCGLHSTAKCFFILHKTILIITKIRPKCHNKICIYYTPLNPNLVIAKKNQSSMQQFGDFVIFLLLRFYVKLVLVSFENQNLRISPNSASLIFALEEFCILPELKN